MSTLSGRWHTINVARVAPVAILTAAGCLSLWLVFLIVVESPLPAILGAGATFAVVLFLCVQRPVFSLWCYVIITYFLTALSNDRIPYHFLPNWGTVLGDVFLFSLFAVTAVKCIGQSEKIRSYFGFSELLIGGFFLTILLSAVANNIQPFTTIATLRLMFVMVGGYLVLRYGDFKLADFHRLFIFFLIVSCIQFPITIGQRFIGNRFLGLGDDLIAGIFSRDPKLIFFQSIILAIALSGLIQHNTPRKLRFLYVLTLVCTIGSIGLSNNRFGMLFILFIPLFVFRQSIIDNIGTVIRIICLFLLIVVPFLWIFVSIYGEFVGAPHEVIPYLTDPGLTWHYFFVEVEHEQGGLRRGYALVYIYDQLWQDELGAPVFGFGPGTLMEWKYDFAMAPQFERFDGLKLWQTQATTIFGELGFAGLFISLLLVISKCSLLRLRPGDFQFPELTALQHAYPAILITMFLMQFYSRVWYEGESAFLFWFATIYLLKGAEMNTVEANSNNVT